MQLEWLKSYFETSPAIGLLRSTYAPFVLAFLSAEFKRESAVIRGLRDLSESLRNFLDRLHDTHPDILTDTAENYLADWCSSKKRYLRRFLDADHDEPLYELTSATEDVLTFLEQMAHRDSRFVGTESRLKRIIQSLADLALGSSDDAAQRLAHLRQERDSLNQQIEAIEAGGLVAIYTPAAIRERFADTLSDLLSLQGDFRAVEEAFKQISRDVQTRQYSSDQTRGQILGEALDAEDGLKGEDQGVSFDEFARLILSPSKQEHVESIIDQVARIETLMADREGLGRIHTMVPSLTAEASKVLRTYQRLSTTLRRLLDRDVRSERARLAAVLGDIRSLAVHLADDPGRRTAARLEIDHEIEISLPLERPFWSPPTEFTAVELKPHAVDQADRTLAFTHLAMLRSLDWRALRRRVDAALAQDNEVTLATLLANEASHHDAVEVMGLIQIAHDDGHFVENGFTEVVNVRHADGTPAALEIPKVMFCRERRQQAGTSSKQRSQDARAR